jgi:hypothetical protein
MLSLSVGAATKVSLPAGDSALHLGGASAETRELFRCQRGCSTTRMSSRVHPPDWHSPRSSQLVLNRQLGKPSSFDFALRQLSPSFRHLLVMAPDSSALLFTGSTVTRRPINLGGRQGSSYSAGGGSDTLVERARKEREGREEARKRERAAARIQVSADRMLCCSRAVEGSCRLIARG